MSNFFSQHNQSLLLIIFNILSTLGHTVLSILLVKCNLQGESESQTGWPTSYLVTHARYV